MARSRAWCFTINNYTENDLEKLKNLKSYSFIIYGKETGESGTPHIQGYIRYKNAVRFQTVKKDIGHTAHIEIARGTEAENIKYCSKEGEYYQDGIPTAQGKRTDLQYVRDIVTLGEEQPMKTICESNIGYQGIRTAEKLLTYLEPQRSWKPYVSWYYGETGTGKTSSGLKEMSIVYVTGGHTKWWDGYDAHENVLIDDLRSNTFSFTYLLSLLDRYPCRVEVKGGFRQFLAKRIIITTNEHPEDMFRYNKEQIEQLLRRIEEIKHFIKLPNNKIFTIVRKQECRNENNIEEGHEV